MEPLLPQLEGVETQVDPIESAISLQDLAAQVDLGRSATWQTEVGELCRAFVTGHRPELRARRVRMAMLAAGCEGVSRASRSAIARLMHLSERLVERETTRLFTRMARTAQLGALPETSAITHIATVGEGIDGLMCARFAAEVLGVRITDDKKKRIAACYAMGGIPAGVQDLSDWPGMQRAMRLS